MPNRPLIPGNNFNNIITWLNENLIENQKINACCIETAMVPKEKGIYFWLMDKSCYKSLHIDQITDVYQRKINEKWYHLVYIGTAGTGRQGNSNLNERLTWHLCQKHTEAAICSGALSTFRTGLSSLLADDLILPETEKVFNEFVCTNMFIYWLTYQDNQIESINSDEKILINKLRPVFNIKNNPNSYFIAMDNPTKNYRIKRLEIIESTRKKLKCLTENEISMKKENPDGNSPLFEEQILSETDNSLSYSVFVHQDIAVVTRGIKNLPNGNIKIKITDYKDPNLYFDVWNFKKTKRIYNYFSSNNTQKNNLGKRSTLIQNWMRDNEIDEIEVKLTWD